MIAVFLEFSFFIGGLFQSFVLVYKQLDASLDVALGLELSIFSSFFLSGISMSVHASDIFFFVFSVLGIGTSIFIISKFVSS
jgi:hypothetical protein